MWERDEKWVCSGFVERIFIIVVRHFLVIRIAGLVPAEVDAP